MLQNNKGYFLLDLLLSLSALFMIYLYLTPLLINIWGQSRQLEIEKTASKLVFEELQKKLVNNSNLTDQAFEHNGVMYLIYWRETSGIQEVCVKVEEPRTYPKTEVCGQLE